MAYQMVSRTPTGQAPEEPDDGDGALKADIAERLRHAVELAGGPGEVSARSGVPLRTLGNYTSARSALKVGALIRLAQACRVSLDWLATGNGPVNPIAQVADFLAVTGDQVVIGEAKVGVDEGLLKAALAALEAHLVAQPAPLSADKKAALVATLYAMGKIDAETVARLVRLAI